MSIVRLAVEEDIGEIVAVVQAAVVQMHAEGNFQWRMDYPGPPEFIPDISKGELWVVVNDGKIVGISALTTEQTKDYEDAGCDISQKGIISHRVCSHPSARGKGIGRILMAQAEIVAKQRKFPYVRIDTHKDNVQVIALCEKLGYTYVGEAELTKRPGHYRNFYEKRLHVVDN